MSNKIRNIDFKTFITSYIPNFYSKISKELKGTLLVVPCRAVKLVEDWLSLDG